MFIEGSVTSLGNTYPFATRQGSFDLVMRTIYRNVIASHETTGFVGKSIGIRLIIFAFDVDHVRVRYTHYNLLSDKEAFTSNFAMNYLSLS